MLGLAGVFTASSPTFCKTFVLFCCCAEVSRSVVVRLPAALPLATQPQLPPNVSQKSTKCILFIKRELERCRCWCHPTASWQPQFGLWQAPGTRIPAHVAGRGAAWLVVSIELLLLLPAPIRNLRPPRPPRLRTSPPRSTMLGQPLGFFYMNCLWAVYLPLLTCWSHSSHTSEPSSQSLNVLAIW